MSNFENSTQLLEKTFDEIVNDDIRTDIASIYSELSYDDKYRVDKPTDNSIMELPQRTDIKSPTINGEIEQNDCNLSSVYGQYQIYSRNRTLDRCSSPQESLCTECRFGNELNDFCAPIDTTQHRPRSSCFLSVIGDQCNKRRLLRKRSLSITLNRRNSESQMRQSFLPWNNLKKFRSEGSISTIENTGSNIRALIPTVVTHEISVQNSTHIDQTVEQSATISNGTIFPDLHHSDDFSKHTVEIGKISPIFSNYGQGSSHLFLPHQVQSELFEQTERADTSPTESTAQNVIKKILIDENTSTDNKTNCRSLNEMILSQSQNFNTNDPNCINTTISRSTIEKIYHRDISDDIEDSKTVDLMKEMQGTDNLKPNNSPLDRSTINEVYCTDAAADIGCLADVEATNEMPEYLTAAENSAPSLINEEIIRGEKIIDTTVIDFGLQPLINSRPNEMDTAKNNLLNFSRKKDLKSEICAVSNTRTEDDPQFQCSNETQLKSTGREVQITTKDIGSDHPIDEPVTTIESAKNPQFSNGEIFEVPEDSILEITAVSESDSIPRQDTIIERGRINSVHFLDNLNRKSTISKTAIKGKRDTKNEPVDLIVDTNSNRTVNVISSKDDDFNTSSLAGRQLENIETQVGMVTKGMTSVNSTISSAANIPSMKYPNTPSEIVQTLRDDLSLEFLSETELQRIEEDAYMRAKGAASAINSINQSTKSVANEQDLFYRPERLNMINEDSNDAMVIPNWMISPSPEPNYDKVKCAVQMRRRYMEKMLQEILRLSSIVSKVGNIVHVGERYSSLGAVSKGSLPIRDSHPMHCIEINANNRSVDLGASGNGCGNSVSEDSGIFYVPHSNRLKYNAPSDKVVAPTSTARITSNDSRKDPEGNSEFYAPQSNRSKYNAANIFNRPNEIELNKGNVSSSYIQSNASNIFACLKHDFNGNKTCVPDISSVWYTGKESETGIQIGQYNGNAVSKNKENLGNRMSARYQLPKISSNVTVSVKDQMELRTNKFEKPVDNDTIFYLSDKLSSGSNNYTMKNSQTLSPVNFTKRPSTRVKVDEPRQPNFVQSSAPHTISDDSSIFYKGNKKKGHDF